MLVLAFDASTPVVAVAVARAGGEAPGAEREVLAHLSVPVRGASEVLLPAIHASLDLADVSLDDVERILVGVGPGTFTGIRIAAAAARSLALATGAALSTGSTLSALAAPALSSAADGTEVLAVLDARRCQVFAQSFGADGSRSEISCVYPEELGARATRKGGSTLVVGDGAVRYREEILALGYVPLDASPLHQVTAPGLVHAADLRPVPAGEVVPVYVREPDAEVRRDLNPWSRQ